MEIVEKWGGTEVGWWLGVQWHRLGVHVRGHGADVWNRIARRGIGSRMWSM